MFDIITHESSMESDAEREGEEKSAVRIGS